MTGERPHKQRYMLGIEMAMSSFASFTLSLGSPCTRTSWSSRIVPGAFLHDAQLQGALLRGESPDGISERRSQVRSRHAGGEAVEKKD